MDAHEGQLLPGSSSRTTVAILTALSVTIALQRLIFLHDPPEWDVATYTLIGREILHGKRLYADVFDVKPPLIYVAYAVAPPFLLGVATSITTMLAVYFATSRLFDRRAGLFAAVVWTVICETPALEANQTNTEALMNAFLALGSALVLARERTWTTRTLAGACFALATLSKQVALVPALAILFASKPRPRDWLTLAIVPLLWVLVILYFALTDRGRLFVDTMFVHPRFYSGGVVNVIRLALDPARLFPHAMIELAPLIGLALFGVFRSRNLVLAAYLVGTFVAVIMPGQFFVHYNQLYLVPLAIAAGFTCSLCRDRRLLRSIPILAILGLVVLQLHWLIPSPRERYARQHPASFVLNVLDTGRQLHDILKSDETMYAWCDEPQLYVLADKRPPAAAIWRMHAIAGPLAPRLTARSLEQLQHSPPDLVVVWSGNRGPEDHPIVRWIADNYVELPESPKHFPLALLARRGSSLADRLASPILAPDAR